MNWVLVVIVFLLQPSIGPKMVATRADMQMAPFETRQACEHAADTILESEPPVANAIISAMCLPANVIIPTE